MAAVLSSEERSYFSSSLRRSQSQTNFGHNPSSFRRSTPTQQISPPLKPPSSKVYTDSDLSSAPSSPSAIQAEFTDVSFPSTPASNVSISSDFDESLGIDESPEDNFSLPLLSQEKFFLQPNFQSDDTLEPPPSPRTGHSYTVSPSEPEVSLGAFGPDTPDVTEHAEDDTAVSSRPSRQVDYLSHDWKEEDIWSSWRYICSKRGEFANSARLENASWRTWTKARNNLKTISPEELNWCVNSPSKPLAPFSPVILCGPKNVNPTGTEPSSVTLSKNDSLVNLNKKPILKKRSMSEVMLQRSLVSASLLKQATAAVQAQETRGVLKYGADKSNAEYYVAYPLSVRRGSQGTGSSVAASTDSSNISSPFPERKHIHFNEQVEQCIAIDVKDDDEEDYARGGIGEDSDSDDGGVMMKRVRSKKRDPTSKKRNKKHANADGKIIAKLPSTTLKYRADTPEPRETAMKHSTGVYRSPTLSPSSSQETLRPAKQSSRFFFGEEDDNDDDDGYSDETLVATSGWRSPPGGAAGVSVHRSSSSGSLSDEPAGMRRTASGMFMPCDEGEVPNGDGLIGRVIDTVNTARDIAHVIWNVGWRK
ncbi:HEX2 protein-like protein [Metarhizium album ARSEF 1941]|uniref:HEX2 protein-like protein n=1 Tax=Metarhizium album (strain ARSEF 1941) TaxID=1081103 RepID=A0A0B2WMC8_METAS|nr:HEX2 protein-like protein [Metarhizium album ARSEF 1941]KHN94170.1 HEX2 protein-like protein [Metarhizium album ARSEF 1941]